MRNQKYLERLYKTCLKELSSIGIIANEIPIEINGRLKVVLGRYKYNHTNTIQKIEINKNYLEQADEHSLKTTILHEICHQLTRGHGHDEVWQNKAMFVNEKLGYNIKTYATKKEIEGIDLKNEDYKYKVTCLCCGYTYKYKRMSGVIKNPNNYKCGCCNGSLKVDLL